MLRQFSIIGIVLLAIGTILGAGALAAPAGQAPLIPPAPPTVIDQPVEDEQDAPAFAPAGPAPEAAGIEGASKSKVNNPGVYVYYDHRNLNPADWPGLFVGGHMTFSWKDIEPTKNNYNWAPIDNFISAQAALGKKVGLEVVSYVGVSSYNPAVKGNVAPGYTASVTCYDDWGREFKVPQFWSTTFQADYQRLINALGARYNNNAQVAWIEVATGADGEAHPHPSSSGGQGVIACLRDTHGMGQWHWENYLKFVVDAYRTAFPDKPLMLPNYPVYLSQTQRKTMGDYSAPLPKGVGFKGDGARPDLDKALHAGSQEWLRWTGLDAPTITYSTTVPVGYESYRMYLGQPVWQYWAVLSALDKRADYLVMKQDTFDDGDPIRWESLRFANRYLGKNVNNTPEVWVALRETTFLGYPQYGNFSFFLTQDDNVAGGRTRAVTYRGTTDTDYPVQNTTMVDAWVNFLVPGSKEGWITRRTDGGNGNPYMWFKVDDQFIIPNGSTNPVSITVTYLDRGTDTWSLEYDGPGGALTSAGIVTKANSGQWKKHTFYIDNSRMSNGLTGGSDFRINCNCSTNAGDEYIHMVMLAKRSGTPSVEIPLQPGANLISIPLITPSTAVADVLSSIAGKYDWIQYFDGATKSWKVLRTSPPIVTLYNIDRTMGFWIYMNQAATLRVEGTRPTTTNIPLRAGANMIGFPSANPQPLATALSSCAGQYSILYEYDASRAPNYWKVYKRTPPIQTLTELRPGFGYWIYVDNDCTLTITY